MGCARPGVKPGVLVSPCVRAHSGGMSRMKTHSASATDREPAAPGVSGRCCDHPDCTRPGEHRAPRARDRLDEYYWFCLEHVREYNKAWNYFAGMSPGQLESFLREDVVGHRPTWRLGALGHTPWRDDQMSDPEHWVDSLGLFRAARARQRADRRRRATGEAPGTPGRPLTPVENAMKVMDLVPPLTLTALRVRYRELVKRYHPDTNGGDRAAEERLKEITQAYSTLRATL